MFSKDAPNPVGPLTGVRRMKIELNTKFSALLSRTALYVVRDSRNEEYYLAGPCDEHIVLRRRNNDWRFMTCIYNLDATLRVRKHANLSL